MYIHIQKSNRKANDSAYQTQLDPIRASSPSRERRYTEIITVSSRQRLLLLFHLYNKEVHTTFRCNICDSRPWLAWMDATLSLQKNFNFEIDGRFFDFSLDFQLISPISPNSNPSFPLWIRPPFSFVGVRDFGVRKFLSKKKHLEWIKQK